MSSCKSKSLYDTIYNQEFKTRMLAAGWTHLNDIYEFEAFRSVHRKESLIMVVPVPLPLVPSMMTVDLGAYSVVADMPTRFQYATTGLYFRETLSGNSFGDIRHMNEDGWLIKALAARGGFWVDPIVLQTKRGLPTTHHGKFVDAQTGNTFGYVANSDNVTNTMSAAWDDKDELANTAFLSTAQAMVRAIDYYGLTKDNDEFVHVGFKDNVFLHITYP